MSFKTVSTLCAALFGTLGLVLLFQPAIVYWLFSVPQNDVGDFFARRAAMLFFGLLALVYLARSTQLPEVRRVVAACLSVCMGGMALIGTFEGLRGYAGAGIWIAIMTEAVICAAYVRFWRNPSAPQ